MKISMILGTRPEIIKLSPLIRYCENNDINYFIIHSNQHYSENMDKIFFEELGLPPPKYNLNVGSGSHGKQTGLIIDKVEGILLNENPTHVFVQGDTNTVMAGAVAASKLKTELVHIEAGLRSYDREMPEELNRIITDHISTILQCPGIRQKNILLKEGISEDKIIVTGNTISDAVKENLELGTTKSTILQKLKLDKSGFCLLTMHRPSNVDNEKKLKSIFQGLESIHNQHNIQIIFPIHPRTKNNIEKFDIRIPEFLRLIEPIGYLDMLQLINNSRVVLTDSGGIQEESCILKVPSLTLRFNTERPETLEVGASILVGNNSEKIIEGFNKIIIRNNEWENPFGTDVAKKIMEKIIK